MILQYLKKWINVWDYLAIDKSKNHITFYSESKNYWSYLKNVIFELAKDTKSNLYYVTSDENDPGLNFSHDNYKTLVIDNGYLRNWFFENLNTNLLVMTTPDLNNSQIKKSNKTNKYIYMHHALNSFSTGINKGGLDYFDVILCACPHQVNEIRILEKYYNLPKKDIAEVGYPRLDDLINNYNEYKKKYGKTDTKSILFAPTWGVEGLLESGGGIRIIKSLIDQNYNVILRPHPETIKHSHECIDDIIEYFEDSNKLDIEFNICSDNSLFKSEALLTDWSGIASEYALALKKPVLFIDTPQKIKNPDYHKLPMISFENQMRDKWGKVWDCKSDISSLIASDINANIDCKDYVFNIGESSIATANYLKTCLND